jgi:hypothetical protein
MSYQKYLNLLEKQTNKYKIVLFATNSARINWDKLSKGYRNTIEFIEQYIDGKITRKQLIKNQLMEITSNDNSNYFHYAAYYAYHAAYAIGDYYVVTYAADAVHCAHGDQTTNWNIIEQIYNDLFNIHPKPPIDHNILNLAQLIYNNQDYSLLPILADALEEQGYDASHFRDKNIHHYRGCDLIDQILKSGENL